MGAHEDLNGAESTSRKEGGRVLLALSEEQWVDLYERLKAFARRDCHVTRNLHDLVMDAMIAVLEERRGWNPNFSPYLNLSEIIRSMASNERKKELRAVSLDSPAGCFLDVTKPAFAPLSARPSPASDYETAEALRNLRKVILAIRSDAPLSRMVEIALYNNRWKSREIADEMGVEVSKVYNAKKRIVRVLARLFGKD